LSVPRLLKHTSIYSVGNVFLRAGALLLIPLYTRVLSLSEYGILELLYSIAAVLGGVLGGGLAHATLRFYFEYDDIEERNSVITTAFFSLVCVVAPLLFIASLGNNLVSKLILGTPRYASAINLIYLSILLELLRQIGLAYLRAREFSILYCIICSAQMILQVTCNFYAVVRLRLGINGILLGNCISIGVCVAILGAIVLKQCGCSFRMSKLKEMLKYSYPFAGTSLTGIFFSNADRFILRGVLSLEAVGIYGLSQKFGLMLTEGVLDPFQKSFGAYRFSIMKQGNTADVQARALKYILLICGVIGCVVAVFSNEAIKLLSERAYWAAARYVPLILFAAIIGSSSYVLQTPILYAKKTKYLFYISLIGDATGLILAFFLIHWIGLLGACLALILKALVNGVLAFLVSERLNSVPYDLRRIGGIIGMLAVNMAIGYSLNQIPIGMLGLVAIKAMICVIGIFAVLRIALDTEESALLLSWCRILFRKMRLTNTTML
jgi:O-antigen/teichoic acid export membrane protein